MEGDAAHGGLLFLGLAPVPGGEGQVQLPGCQESVLIEHFIEIPQAEEENAVSVLLFHCPVLPLHGGEVCGGCSHDRSVSAAKAAGEVNLEGMPFIRRMPSFPSGSRWWRR